MIRYLKKVVATRKLTRFLAGRRFIFCYHDISPSNASHHAGGIYSTTPERFQDHINLFESLLNIVPLKQLAQDPNLSKSQVHASITFDDGFRSVYEYADPILSARNIPYTLFLNGTAIEHNQLWMTNLMLLKDDEPYLKSLYDNHLTGDGISLEEFLESPVRYIRNFKNQTHLAENALVDSTKVPGIYLNKEEIRKLIKKGVLIGNHSMDHLNLSMCQKEDLIRQIELNKEYLEDSFDIEVTDFAIPFGKREHYDHKVLGAIHQAGHKHIFSTNVDSFGRKDVLNAGTVLPRIVITHETVEEVLFYLNRTIFKTYNI